MRLPAPAILSDGPSMEPQLIAQPQIVNDFRFFRLSMPAPPPRSTAYAPPVLSKSSAAAPPLGGVMLLQAGFCAVITAAGKFAPEEPVFDGARPAFSLNVSS